MPGGSSPTGRSCGRSGGQATWGDTHYLRVYMTGLRRKLEVNPSLPRHIRTESGVGYRLVLAD